MPATVASDYCDEIVTEEDAERTLSECTATRGATYMYTEDVLTNADKASVVMLS